MGHVAPPVADQPPILREEAGDGQLIKSREHQPVGQVPRRPVEDEDGWLWNETGVSHGRRSLRE